MDLEDHLQLLYENGRCHDSRRYVVPNVPKNVPRRGNRMSQGLTKGSIQTFESLEMIFRQAYIHQIRRQSHRGTLLNIEQGTLETLREYIK